MTPADRTWTPEDQGWLRENLREAIDHLVEMGYTVRGGQGEDPELIHPGGSAVQTWREDYPYERTDVPRRVRAGEIPAAG